MPSLTSYSSKRFLIVDDLPEMRSSLRSQVASLGCESVAVVANVRSALEQLASGAFDVILCDYYLGGGTDGQQFLEYVRSRRLISRGTLFLMITAEKSYSNVVTAAECLPDDYLLKPFTADTLQARLERLLEKKVRLAKVDAMQDKERWSDVVSACDEIIAARDRYQIDAMRIRGNALIAGGRTAEAVDFYKQVLGMRSMPWARFGLARALHAQGEIESCKENLNELIAEAPQLLSAYDLLGRVHLESGQAKEALDVLDQACTIAPNSLTRHRAIAKVAEEQADFGRVESALSQVIKKTRNSPLRETADIARLGNAFAELGQPDKAIELIEDAKKNFKKDASDPHLAAVESLAHHKAGRPELAAAALTRVLDHDPGALSQEVAVALAKACLASGQQDKGEALLKLVVQSNPDSKAAQSQVSDAMKAYGSAERAQALIRDGVQEVIALNNEAVRRGKAGELGEAAKMLTEAALRLPGNVQIVSNAAYALLLDIYTNGLDASKLRDALQFQKTAVGLNARYPKLAEIAELQRRIRSKFGQAPEAGETK
ncbi:MAG: tetratricopeptide repeat protein [Zoogloea sp.]|nr:tetratricopeptide repeat protein [Zoogloea sp.]